MNKILEQPQVGEQSAERQMWDIEQILKDARTNIDNLVLLIKQVKAFNDVTASDRELIASGKDRIKNQLEELEVGIFESIDDMGDVIGSKKQYSPDELKRLVKGSLDLNNEKITMQYITNSEDSGQLRDKVKEFAQLKSDFDKIVQG